MKYLFKTKPRDYQYEALKFIVKNNGVTALLMDPGVGKTKVTIDYLGMLTAKYGNTKALISAPLSALDTWADETALHLGTYLDEDGEEHEIDTRIFILDEGAILEKASFIKQLDEDFTGLTMVVTNHDAFKYRHKVPGLKTVTVRDRIIRAVELWSPDITIVDEMHRLKTHSSNLSTAFKKVGRYSFRRLGLTGTVAPHSPLDFYGQWQFLNPQLFNVNQKRAWDNFRYYYAMYGGYEGRQVIGFHASRLKEMKELIAQDAFIVRKRDALDLPPVTDIKVPVQLTTERHYYLEMGEEYMVDLPQGGQSISRNTLTKMLRLRQITSGFIGYKEPLLDEGGDPVLDKDGAAREVSKTQDIGDSKLKTMMDKVESIVDAGKKQVIFAHFRRDVARITEHCQNSFKKVPVYTITGDTPSPDRLTQRKDFYNHEGPAIFVAQMRTVSLAINEFVCASYGHFYSMSQLRDDFIQARDRLDRQGQTEPVTFYYYVVPKSIDDVILENHKEKGKLEAAVTKRAREILTLGEE